MLRLEKYSKMLWRFLNLFAFCVKKKHAVSVFKCEQEFLNFEVPTSPRSWERREFPGEWATSEGISDMEKDDADFLSLISSPNIEAALADSPSPGTREHTASPVSLILSFLFCDELSIICGWIIVLVMRINHLCRIDSDWRPKIVSYNFSHTEFVFSKHKLDNPDNCSTRELHK